MDRLPPRRPARRLRRLSHGSMVLAVPGRHPLYSLPAGLRQGHGKDRGPVQPVSIALLLLSGNGAFAQTAGQPAPPPRVLLFFSLNVEADHVQFATDAMKFFAKEADKHGFRVEATSNWEDMNGENLKQVKLVV